MTATRSVLADQIAQHASLKAQSSMSAAGMESLLVVQIKKRVHALAEQEASILKRLDELGAHFKDFSVRVQAHIDHYGSEASKKIANLDDDGNAEHRKKFGNIVQDLTLIQRQVAKQQEKLSTDDVSVYTELLAWTNEILKRQHTHAADETAKAELGTLVKDVSALPVPDDHTHMPQVIEWLPTVAHALERMLSFGMYGGSGGDGAKSSDTKQLEEALAETREKLNKERARVLKNREARHQLQAEADEAIAATKALQESRDAALMRLEALLVENALLRSLLGMDVAAGVDLATASESVKAKIAELKGMSDDAKRAELEKLAGQRQQMAKDGSKGEPSELSRKELEVIELRKQLAELREKSAESSSAQDKGERDRKRSDGAADGNAATATANIDEKYRQLKKAYKELAARAEKVEGASAGGGGSGSAELEAQLKRSVDARNAALADLDAAQRELTALRKVVPKQQAEEAKAAAASGDSGSGAGGLQKMVTALEAEIGTLKKQLATAKEAATSAKPLAPSKSKGGDGKPDAKADSKAVESAKAELAKATKAAAEAQSKAAADAKQIKTLNSMLADAQAAMAKAAGPSDADKKLLAEVQKGRDAALSKVQSMQTEVSALRAALGVAGDGENKEATAAMAREMAGLSMEEKVAKVKAIQASSKSTAAAGADDGLGKLLSEVKCSGCTACAEHNCRACDHSRGFVLRHVLTNAASDCRRRTRSSSSIGSCS